MHYLLKHFSLVLKSVKEIPKIKFRRIKRATFGIKTGTFRIISIICNILLFSISIQQRKHRFSPFCLTHLDACTNITVKHIKAFSFDVYIIYGSRHGRQRLKLVSLILPPPPQKKKKKKIIKQTKQKTTTTKKKTNKQKQQQQQKKKTTTTTTTNNIFVLQKKKCNTCNRQDTSTLYLTQYGKTVVPF